jgi:hypothetical protein
VGDKVTSSRAKTAISSGKRRFTATFEAIPGDIPAEVRLKRLLKSCLRAFDLRCTEIREEPAPDDDIPRF